MPDQTTASWILMSSFAILLILRFPVALTLVGSTVITLWYLDLPIIVASQQMIQGITNYSLLAIPFFILTGQILQEGGLAHRIVAMTNVFVGRIRGGLALANSVAWRALLPIWLSCCCRDRYCCCRPTPGGWIAGA